jgi:hypothetical protein
MMTHPKEAFLKENDEFKNLRQVQLDSIKLQNGTRDYWIDEGSMYTYQQKEQYTIQYSVDDEGNVTVDTPNMTTKQSMIMAFSDFDKPVNIKAPADAQPLDNIVTLIM